ncbi:MAG TPA: hypothetical protein VNK03_01235 [Gammaproteobacteria bacterium]|nr:hypothetical protein [Gammaproteobacteria bacterium]
MELDKGKKIVNAFFSLLGYTLSSVFFIIDKKISIFYRKFYVWKVLSSRGNWHLSRNGNLYNPTFQTTVYPWDGAWNIAKFNMHYTGFYSQEYAKRIAFQQWYREYKANNLIALINYNVSKSFITRLFACYKITFIVFIVILSSILYNLYQPESKSDKRPKEFDSIFNKNQEDVDSDHQAVDRTQKNPHQEEMKKYQNAVQECGRNFSFLSKEHEECESFFRQKYKEIIENYYTFENNEKQKILESIKRNF